VEHDLEKADSFLTLDGKTLNVSKQKFHHSSNSKDQTQSLLLEISNSKCRHTHGERSETISLQ